MLFHALVVYTAETTHNVFLWFCFVVVVVVCRYLFNLVNLINI